MKYFPNRLLVVVLAPSFAVASMCFFNVAASEDRNTEQAITSMLSATGQYHSAKQFMQIYGITNVFMPSHLQSHWVAAEFINAENSCLELMHLAMRRQQTITHAGEREAYVTRLKKIEADYWQARITLAHGHLEKLGELIAGGGPSVAKKMGTNGETSRQSTFELLPSPGIEYETNSVSD